ncbi:C-C motif chemokine 3-like [Epinephelus lanceolatus]
MTQGNPPELEPMTPRSPPKLVLTAPRCPQKLMSVSADDYCFSFHPRSLNKNHISSYVMTDFRCSKAAVILISKKGRRICVDPNVSWVKSIMKSVDDCTT